MSKTNALACLFLIFKKNVSFDERKTHCYETQTKMKKSLIYIALFFAISQSVVAQQIFQLTQYANNKFAYNPAVAGSNDYFTAQAGFRKQWAGIEGAPTTIHASVEGNLSQKKSVGLGLLLYNDATGPTSRFGVQIGYAYQLPLNLDGTTQLGFGIAGSLLSQSVDFDQLVLGQGGDPQIGTNAASKFGADAHLGVYLKGKSFSVGLSANQLFGSKFKIVTDDAATIENARHFYLAGDYHYDINEKIALEPTLLLKMVQGANPQAEINLRGYYQNKYWLGVGYRTEDALALMLGAKFADKFSFSYSYDLTTSKLSTVSNGSHELRLAYQFGIF